MEKNRNKVDLHSHSTKSDGTATPTEILEKVKEQGISVFSITDHDTMSANSEIIQLHPENMGLIFIPGVEISCQCDELTYHILGLNYNVESVHMRSIVEKNNSLAKEKMADMLLYLKEYNIVLSEGKILNLMQKKSPRKGDLARIICEEGYACDIESAMQNILDKFQSDKKYSISVQEAAGAIHNSGGLVVWAHPLRGKSNRILSYDDFINKYNKIKSYLDGLEAFYWLFNKTEYEFLENFANNHNLLISAGSDYHGLHKKTKLGQLNRENTEIDMKRITILKNILP